MEQAVLNAISSTISDLGFDIVKLSIRNGDPKVLEILIERLDGVHVSIGDCRIVSKNISALLDVEDIIKDKYYLEVSSAGIERPLVKFNDYIKFVGRSVKLKLKSPFEGRGRYSGEIIYAKDNLIGLKESTSDGQVEIPFELISKANLLLTDDLFRKLLKQK